MASSADTQHLPQPVDRRLEHWPVIHCELCGAVSIAMLPSTQFCIECGLYVCMGCWRDADSRCRSCARSLKRPSTRVHVWNLRRADRRLREVIAELHEPDDNAGNGWGRSAEASIKIEASLRAAEVAVAHLPRARQRPRVAVLVRRIERNGASARAGLERLGERHSVPELVADIADHGPMAGGHRRPRGVAGRRLQRRAWIAAGAAAAVLSVLVGWSLFGATPREGGIAEGVLGGGPQASATASPSSGAGGAERTAAVPSPIRNVVAAFDFDDRQMESGLGPGWRDAGGGEVSLAAFPTGVDRSARLVADGRTPAITCRAIDPGARVVEVDVFLDPLVPVAARVELTDATDGAVMTIELSRSRTLVSIGADVVEGAGVAPATWLHVETRSEDGGVAWEVSERKGGSEPSAHGRREGIATEGLTEICLEVEATPGGTAHFDNLAIEWTNGEGG